MSVEGPIIEAPYYLGAKSEAGRSGLLINLAQVSIVRFLPREPQQSFEPFEERHRDRVELRFGECAVVYALVDCADFIVRWQQWWQHHTGHLSAAVMSPLPPLPREAEPPRDEIPLILPLT